MGAISQTDYGYTGQRELDPGLGGLMDYRARFFSPSLGRFLQPDSLIPDAKNPQAWNRYSYVVNRPVNFNDPTGHWIDEGCGTGGAGGGTGCTLPKPKPRPSGNDGLISPLPTGDVCQVISCDILTPYWAPPLYNDCGLLRGSFDCTGDILLYRSYTFGLTVLPPVGAHGTITQDRYNQWYIGGGFDLSLLPITGSFADGYINKSDMPQDLIGRPAYVEEFITDMSNQWSVAPFAFFGWNLSWSTESTSDEYGIAIPDVSVGWTITFRIP